MPILDAAWHMYLIYLVCDCSDYFSLYVSLNISRFVHLSLHTQAGTGVMCINKLFAGVTQMMSEEYNSDLFD